MNANDTGTNSTAAHDATSNTSSGVVHVISATLRSDLPGEVVASTLTRARALRDAPGARTVLVAHTTEAVIVATWLPGRAEMEAFAASPPHMEFVMRGLAPSITGMWATAVETAAPPPLPGDVAALWAFAVRSAETVFEWQVRDVLASIAQLPAKLAAGPTFEERDRYRAGGVACIPTTGRDAFTSALATARHGWGEMAPHVVEATAEVVE